jgi:hypothetical protein
MARLRGASLRPGKFTFGSPLVLRKRGREPGELAILGPNALGLEIALSSILSAPEMATTPREWGLAGRGARNRREPYRVGSHFDPALPRCFTDKPGSLLR